MIKIYHLVAIVCRIIAKRIRHIGYGIEFDRLYANSKNFLNHEKKRIFSIVDVLIT